MFPYKLNIILIFAMLVKCTLKASAISSALFIVVLLAWLSKMLDDLQLFRELSPLIRSLLFGVKDPIPGGLRSRVVYKFACAGCNACPYFRSRPYDFSIQDKRSFSYSKRTTFS